MNTKPIILTAPVFEDFRGYLAVPYDKSINFNIRQINQGYSKKAYTLRGLHFQEGEYAQAKRVSLSAWFNIQCGCGSTSRRNLRTCIQEIPGARPPVLIGVHLFWLIISYSEPDVIANGCLHQRSAIKIPGARPPVLNCKRKMNKI